MTTTRNGHRPAEETRGLLRVLHRGLPLGGLPETRARPVLRTPERQPGKRFDRARLGRRSILDSRDPALHATAASLPLTPQTANSIAMGCNSSSTLLRDPRTSDEGDWRGLKYNLTAAESRQLGAQLIAAADSHDGIGQDVHIMHRLEKIAAHVGANIFGA